MIFLENRFSNNNSRINEIVVRDIAMQAIRDKNYQIHVTGILFSDMELV